MLVFFVVVVVGINPDYLVQEVEEVKTKVDFNHLKTVFTKKKKKIIILCYL